MSIPYERGGREQQKRRTREALVAAAHKLIASGQVPTVEQTAAAAGISRTTAYRYFPTQRALLAAAYPYIERQSLLPSDLSEQDVALRLDAVVDAHTRQTLQNEAALRAMLRLSLEPDEQQRQRLLLRQGRAIGWIEEALAPLKEHMGEPEVRRLAVAIRSVEGIEALVWLTDVARLGRDEAAALMRWSAQALLRTALADGPPPAGRSGPSVKRSG